MSMAKQRTYSNTNSNSYSSSKQNQTNVSKNTSKQTNKSNATTNQNGGSYGVSYKDLSGLSPETLALQQKVYSNTGYTPSQAVQNAYGQKTNAEQAVSNYGTYNSNYKAAIDKTLNDILNRKSFSYDFNADALYKNYKDSYEQQGKRAAENAAAAAAALTGGYGNSYGVSSAHQANEQYMTQLNDRIPELYQLAVERYNMENQDLYNRYNALGTQEDRAYGQWSDGRQNLVADRDYYGSNYHNMLNSDMTAQQNAYNNAMELLNYRTGLETRDVTESSNWSKSKEKSTSTSKGYDKNRQTSTSTSYDNQKTSSSTASTTTGSGGSSSKSGRSSSRTKKYGFTTTSDDRTDEIKDRFENNLGKKDEKTGEYDARIKDKALQYLYGLCISEDNPNGLITKIDADYIKRMVLSLED